jgi:hypothetical protein
MWYYSGSEASWRACTGLRNDKYKKIVWEKQYEFLAVGRKDMKEILTT